MNGTRSSLSRSLTRDDLIFGVATCVMVVFAHWVAYLSHEYAHTFMAWALGWMADPLALDYGPPTVYNVLFLGEVGDNVSYGPILAGGHGVSAAIIALSGIVIGNALVYFISYGLLKSKPMASSHYGTCLAYWLALMCVGNVWGYVPIRALTTHADIAIAAGGLGSPAALVLVTALTAYWFFAFFGGDGTDGSYGIVSQVLAIGSKYFMFPIAVMFLTQQADPAPPG